MPISVDSQEKLIRIGAAIEHKPVKEEGGDDYMSFQVSWKPTFKLQNGLGYRLDLIVRKDNNDNRPIPTKFHGRYHLGEDGRCHADFSLARSEMAFASLAFRGSWNFEYWVSLEDFINGFPGEEDSIFFIDPLEAEDGAEQPAAAKELKPEEDQKPKPETEVRRR